MSLRLNDQKLKKLMKQKTLIPVKGVLIAGSIFK